MSKLKLNIIGCGKLGKAIGRLLVRTQEIEVIGIVNAKIESAMEALKFVGEGQAFPTIAALPSADLYFITTTDDKIAASANVLSDNKLPKGAMVIHCSGMHSSAILNAVKRQDCYTASIHPIKSVVRPDDVHDLANTYCAVEGDAFAVSRISALFKKMGAIIFEINKDDKKWYHAASVMANNYLVTLHYQAFQCYLKANIDEPIAKLLASSLMQDALNHLKDLPHALALTGPLQRGDIETVKEHMKLLQTTAPEIKNLYQALGMATLALMASAEEEQEMLREIFAGKE